ncbi:hypothetical protein F5148DRAFT_848842 [Russula earlei]|uniref:Uncharacterized protein n=1 Tax=Russula earlei TaxID=71964 RepID=A0ACC0UMG4_9AGAM|nr:hypothetical protein F5148DRAFT_848842 [Russula earlei]
MSLQANLSSPDIATAYQDILNARGIDWVILTYEKASNDLRVQSTGNGLQDLEEEFSDGRIQYAFARVTDPNTRLPKFVQINWCGDGVPEAKKGFFHTHSSAVARFFRGTHVVINARNESDVTPSLIMSRVESASGSKYSAHLEPERKFEPIAPVGTNYTPVGKVDISALRSAVAPTPPKSAIPSISRPFVATHNAPSSSEQTVQFTAVSNAVPAAQVPADAWDAPTRTVSAGSKRPLAVPRPPPSVAAESFSISTGFATVPSSNIPTKPSPEDRIAPIGTAYTPVSLPPPRKLNNPFEARAQAALASQPSPRSTGASSGKMTWSERQALAKKRADEEEIASRAAADPLPSRLSPSMLPNERTEVGKVDVSVLQEIAIMNLEPDAEVSPPLPLHRRRRHLHRLHQL